MSFGRISLPATGLAVIYGLAAVTAQVAAADDSKRKITESEIRSVWAKQAREYYMVYGTIPFPKKEDRRDLDLLRDKGYITYKIEPLSVVQQSAVRWEATAAYEITFTPEGRNNSLLVKSEFKDREVRCFSAGVSEIDRIVDISPSGTVLIAGHFVPNDLGSALGEGPFKYRFKLQVSYDAFLDTFNLAELRFSQWDVEKWSEPWAFRKVEGDQATCHLPRK